MINATGDNKALSSITNKADNPKGVLGKDDFMKLLLVQLQYQDPTQPMDTEKILTQTSQLASLESADNTKVALEKLADSLGNAQQFSTISAIGKTADLGSDAISFNKGDNTTFELFFPNDVSQGSIEIKDTDGNIIKTLDIGSKKSGVYKFTWDGSDNTNNTVNSGVYHVSATYNSAQGQNETTKLGTYPIEAVRFDKGNTLVKVGSSYVPLDNIKEVY